MHPHHNHVLQPDIQGTPQAWTSLERSAVHLAARSVAWVDGDGPRVYLPHVPSRFEDILLDGRHIRADVHERLAARLPKGSRLS